MLNIRFGSLALPLALILSAFCSGTTAFGAQIAQAQECPRSRPAPMMACGCQRPDGSRFTAYSKCIQTTTMSGEPCQTLCTPCGNVCAGGQ